MYVIQIADNEYIRFDFTEAYNFARYWQGKLKIIPLKDGILNKGIVEIKFD